MPRRIRASDFGRLVREKLRRDQKELRRAAIDACSQAVPELVAATDRAGLSDTDTFRNGWSVQPLSGGAEIGNDAPHADAIEYGRRPGRPGPPIAPIRGWVARKIAPPPEQLDRVAWAVRDKIHRDGSPPKLILTSYRPRLREVFFAIVRRRLRRR